MGAFTQNRRSFLKTAGAAGLLAAPWIRANESRKFKAAIIGRTGGGDYGHGFERIFEGLDNVSVEAIADANPKGLEAAAARSGAKRKYADFHEMLEKERPHLVSIAPRQPDCHKEMALSAIEVGAHIIIEKPFTEHLNEADEILQAATKKGIKIVVGHKNRYTDVFASMKHHLEGGLIGHVLEMRVQGKQDARAGGGDLIVLGTHDFDTMRWFFGNPVSCSASVTTKGKGITKADVGKGREPMLVAGDTIHAQFNFPRNVHCSWHSAKVDDGWNVPPPVERWGFHIFGTKGIMAYYSGSQPLWYDSPFLGHKTVSSDWKPLPGKVPARPAHQSHLAKDLIHAIERGTKPLCDGEDGLWTIEMLASVYESQRLGAVVRYPLKDRTNPLLRL